MTRFIIGLFCCTLICLLVLFLVLVFLSDPGESPPRTYMNNDYYMVIGGKSKQAKVVKSRGIIDRDYGTHFTARFDNAKVGFGCSEAFKIRPSETVSINTYSFNPEKELPEIPEQFHGKPSENLHIVQFSGAVARAHLEELILAGIVFKGYLPDYSCLVKASPSQLAVVRNHAEVKSVTPFFPAYKLDHRMLALKTDMMHVCLSTWNNGQMLEAVEIVKQNNGNILDTCEWLVDAIIPFENMISIAEHDIVRTIELVEDNLSNLCCYNGAWEIQTDISEDFKVWDKGLHGEGLTLGIIDGGLEIRHEMFHDPNQSWVQYSDQSYKYGPNYSDPGHRKIANYWVHPKGDEGPSLVASVWHGTGVNGIVAGDNSKSGNSNWTTRKDGRGMAYEARIAFVDVSPATSAGSIPSTTIPWFGYILEYDNAFVSSGSWTMTSGNYYHTSCVDTDTMLWENRQQCLVFSNGHKAYSKGTSPSENRETCGSPASAKNVVSATALGGAKFAFGPARDGRVKPNIRAPYYLSTAYAPNWATNGYMVIANIGGTSSAAPVVNGGLTMIRQYFLEGWYPTGTKTPANSIEPSGALLRAVLYAGAREYTGSKCDYLQEGINVHNNSQGWGDIDLDGSLYFAGDQRKLLVFQNGTGLDTGGQNSYAFEVTGTSEPVRVVMVYTDYPGVYCTLSAPSLVNDLDLTVSAPSGKIYLGNVFEGKNPTHSVEGGSRDDLNNEEGCIFPDTNHGLEAGIYTIAVSAVNVPQGPQPFAIAVTGVVAESSVGPAPPIVNITNPENGATSTVPEITVSGMASTNEPGAYVTYVETRLNGGDWLQAQETQVWSISLILSEGINIIEARAHDNGGRESSVRSISVEYNPDATDTTPPIVSIVKPASGSTSGYLSVTVEGIATDTGNTISGIDFVQCRNNGGEWITAAGTESWSILLTLSEGENNIEARATDRAGQSSDIASVSVNCQPLPFVPKKTGKESFGCSLDAGESRYPFERIVGFGTYLLLMFIAIAFWKRKGKHA